MPKDSNPNFWWHFWEIQGGIVVELLGRHERTTSTRVNKSNIMYVCLLTIVQVMRDGPGLFSTLLDLLLPPVGITQVRRLGFIIL
jgi:hypothetical protein